MEKNEKGKLIGIHQKSLKGPISIKYQKKQENFLSKVIVNSIAMVIIK